MTIRNKMILIFSLMMVIALSSLTFYSIYSSFQYTYAYNTTRFSNMQATITQALDQQFSLMELAIDELISNTSFTSALNQFVRNDSDDQKIAYAARNRAQQQLYNSPLVDNFHSVTFFSRNGKFITNFVEKDIYLTSGSEQTQDIIAEIPWLDQADAKRGKKIIIAPHNDFLSAKRDTIVYSMAVAVYFHGTHIGYIEISDQFSTLQDIMSLTDDSSILTQAVFNDGTVFYSASDTPFSYPSDMEQDVLIKIEKTSPSYSHRVMHNRISWLNLDLYIAQDEQLFWEQSYKLFYSHLKTGIIIMIPTLLGIFFISHDLTKSIQRLRKKVDRLPINDIVHADETAIKQLGTPVTSRYDYEIYDLEQIVDASILKLHESALAQLSLQTDTLQAQLHTLQAQINPHFIYNTLNIISAKAMETKNYEIIEICDQFASMLRYSTDTRSNTATLEEEIENAKNYLQLAKARYEDYLTFSIEIPEVLNSVLLPKLTLQPLVENAITHGYTGKNMYRHLSITGEVKSDYFVIEIRDNGTGFRPEQLVSINETLRKIKDGLSTSKDACGHIGLVGTCLRLHYYSHGSMCISIRNDNGAVITISLPYSIF